MAANFSELHHCIVKTHIAHGPFCGERWARTGFTKLFVLLLYLSRCSLRCSRRLLLLGLIAHGSQLFHVYSCLVRNKPIPECTIDDLIIHFRLFVREWRIQKVLFLRRQILLNLGFDASEQKGLQDAVQLLYHTPRCLCTPRRERACRRLYFPCIVLGRTKVEPRSGNSHTIARRLQGRQIYQARQNSTATRAQLGCSGSVLCIHEAVSLLRSGGCLF